MGVRLASTTLRHRAGFVQTRAFGSYPEHSVLVMPALSPTMEAGGLETWEKREGDAIKEGDKLASIETDKATLDLDAVEDGYLAKILVPEGSKDVRVNRPIAVICENKDDVAAFKDFVPEDEGDASDQKSEEAPKKEEPKKQEPKKQESKQAESSKSAESKSTTSSSAPTSEGDRIFASPAARKEAEARSLDLKSLSASGPNGRIVLADVLDAKPASRQAKESSASSAAPAASAGDYRDVPVSQIKRVTAQRLTEAKRSIPHYYLSVDARVDELMAVRAQLNASLAKEKNGVKLSVNDFVIKATANALREVPALNSHWQGDSIREYSVVHMGVAVNTDHGLFCACD